MSPDLELLREAIGSPPSSTERVDTGGYTRSRAWRVETRAGALFAKEAEDKGSLHMLRREALVYESASAPFLPAFVGFADSGERALLAIELLEDAHWPPPYPADVTPLFEALSAVVSTEPPAGLPRQRHRRPCWPSIADDPEPLLALGVCSGGWLENAIGTLVASEAEARFEGDALVHNDVYSGNVAFRNGRAVLVDWGASVCGSPWIDVAFALLSVRVEGAPIPAVDFPDEGAFAAALAGHFAAEATRPLPGWAEPGSTLREDMIGDLRHALVWAAERLELPPLN